MSVWPLPYRSASAGVEKPLSDVNQGNPGRVAPVEASMAYSSWPRDGATASRVVPWRSPRASDALTAEVWPALGSLAGFLTGTNQRSVPFGLNAS